MSTALSSLRKVALASLGAAGLALVAYLVEHGDVPEWMRKVFSGIWALLTGISGWIWNLLTATSEWALWEILVPIFAVGALAILFLYQEATKIARLHSHISLLSKKLEKSKERERELNAQLDSDILKTKDGSLSETVSHPLTEQQFGLLLRIANTHSAGAIVTRQGLQSATQLSDKSLSQALNALKESDHIIQMMSASGASYLLSPVGRKLVLSYLKK